MIVMQSPPVRGAPPPANSLSLLALVSVITGLVVAYVAWQQWRTARARLKLDLYERRLKVFEAVMRFFDKIAATGTASYEAINALTAGTIEARFLFKEDIVAYIDKLRTQAIELRHAEGQVRGRNTDAPDVFENWSQKYSALRDWYTQQYQDAPEKFSAYLAFRDSL